ncbi:PfkB family carbohydrate kinase [Bacillus licheniformis]|nr:PfkB family carbohydrate kinase [Bacillus licheniformis]
MHYGKELLDRGAERVLISRGKDGALYLDRQRTLKATAAKGKVVNTACAGDAMLAVFVGNRSSAVPFLKHSGTPLPPVP